jgi:hypothetical protein
MVTIAASSQSEFPDWAATNTSGVSTNEARAAAAVSISPIAPIGIAILLSRNDLRIVE